MDKAYFTAVLQRVRDYATGMGLQLIDSKDLDPYFKGDLNGTKIWINFDMDDEEELFNTLHLIGHCVQWGVDAALKHMGAELHLNPDDKLLRELQAYEWQANCYGLGILHELGVNNLDMWMYKKYEYDICLLTHFYKTGEKVKEITAIARQYSFLKQLEPKLIPKTFVPVAIQGSRNGIVIDFNS